MNQWFTRIGTTFILCSISVPSTALTLSSDRNLSIPSQTTPNSPLAQAQLAQTNQPEFELQDFDFWADQCRSSVELKDYENGIKACERAIVLKPKQDNLDLWMARSDALLQLKRYPEALASYSHVLSVTPNSSLALTQKCAILYQLGSYETAIDACESALRIDGNWGTSTPAFAWYNRGLALQLMGRTADALDSYNRAQQITPNDLLVQAERCRLLPLLKPDATVEQNCGSQDAITAYENALANNPNDAIVWTHQGLSLEQVGYTTRALTAYNNAVQINPKSSTALAHQCALLNQVKQYQEALTACESALKGDGIWQGTSPDFVWSQQSRALIGLEKYEEAIAMADRAIALNPNNAEALNYKAVSLWQLAKVVESTTERQELYRQALTTIQQAIAIAPQDSQAWFNQGRIQSSLQDYDSAVQAYCQALNTTASDAPNYCERPSSETASLSLTLPGDMRADILANLSAAFWHQQNYKGAFTAAVEATALNPQSFMGWYNQGLAANALNDGQQAERAYRAADRLSSNNLYVLTGIGKALVVQGKTQEAIAIFDLTLNLDPNFAPAQAALNQLLKSRKDVVTP